jgi:3alpha(or 20beta)-hydroxysteroid dehydrogenase
MTSEKSRPRLEGRVAIVSGGARGIGEAHVRALAGEGAHVVIGDVLADEGAALAEQLGERVRSVTLDVTSEADWTTAVAAAEQDGWGPGAVTILINNAGIMDPSPIGELSAERWRRTIDVNLTGHFLGLTTAAALELGGDGIRVNSLHPGMIRTAMTEGAPEESMAAKYPLRRFGTPEEMARTMLFIVCDASYASGDAFPVDGGILAGIMMGE